MSRLGRRLRGSRPRLLFGLFGACVLLASCAPKVGSPRWCEAMREKPRGDWTANEALDYARYCIVN